MGTWPKTSQCLDFCIRLTAYIFTQKYLEEFDTSSAGASQTAELSRLWCQFKEANRKKNKPSGRKLLHKYKDAKQMNWRQPFIWSDIEKAACRAGKPWQPRAIMQEAK